MPFDDSDFNDLHFHTETVTIAWNAYIQAEEEQKSGNDPHSAGTGEEDEEGQAETAPHMRCRRPKSPSKTVPNIPICCP